MRALAVRVFRHWRHHGSISTAKAILGRLQPSRKARQDSEPQSPSNYGTIRASDEEIEHDANYAVQVARSYIGELPGGAAALQQKSILELGPGRNFGSALILRSWGAKQVAVADRFLVRFQADYHAPLYRRIAAIVREQPERVFLDPLYDCAAKCAHLPLYITALEVPLEKLSEIAPERFDITLSNAVLEHLYDPLRAIQSLSALSRPGGIGLHQVDFRDHRNFAKPLEYLLPDEVAFKQMLKVHHGEYGNRIRPHEMYAMFVANFEVVKFNPNAWIDSRYLEDFIPRLRACRNSPYYDIDVTRLSELGGRFFVAKKIASK
jgi:SAM-dependent methyltransferase